MAVANDAAIICGMQWMASRVEQTTLVLSVSASFLIGVLLARRGLLIDWLWPLLAGAFAIFSWRKHSLWTLIWVMLFGLSLGWWRGSVYVQHLQAYQAHFGQRVTLLATAGEDATYNKYKQLTFDAHDVAIENTGERLVGKISLSGFGEPAVFAGDVVRVSGKLQSSLGSYQARMTYGQLEVVKRSNAWVPQLRREFAAGMQSALPEPLASFGMGLLIGQRANLPQHVYDALLMVGLVHIIAVSGYNLTIILRATEGLLKKHSKRLSLLLSFGLIGLFLLFAGASASIVRAAIISVLALMAAYYGRRVRPIVLLLFAAAITAWLNPYYLWGDASWYLSFLAFFGVLIIAPMVLARVSLRVQNSLIATVAIETLCAEIMTIPYVLYVFGQMSFAGLLANILVAIFVPLAMLLCLVAGLAGMLIPAVAGWLAWPARYLLTYMLDVAQLISNIPHVFVEGIKLPLVQLALLYGALLGATIVLWHKTKDIEPVRITDEAEV